MPELTLSSSQGLKIAPPTIKKSHVMIPLTNLRKYARSIMKFSVPLPPARRGHPSASQSRTGAVLSRLQTAGYNQRATSGLILSTALPLASPYASRSRSNFSNISS
jgi:hypothetical protein